MKNPPIYTPIQPIEISDRWFPAGLNSVYTNHPELLLQM